MSVIKVPQLAWYETSEMELPLPDSWQVETGNMAGYDRPAMKPDQIKAAIGNPDGTLPIKELARGKKEVAIIFDDMTRVTRAAGIIPFVLEELAEAGIPDSGIRFICALGAHGSLNRSHWVKKLGEEVVARFPVYNHNAFGECTYVGKTKTYGTEVYINAEVMKCDLKIAIGSVVPHPMNGFGGGGKIILPGIASFDTIKNNHDAFYHQTGVPKDRRVTGMGLFDENPLRKDIEEAAILSGLDVMINCLVNTWGETISVYAGTLQTSYSAAVREAKEHYLTPRLKNKDIVIANTFAKANEGWIGSGIAYRSVNREQGGEVVIIANEPEGQVTHYLLGPFGKDWHGPLARGGNLPPYIKRLIVFTEYPDLASRWWFGEPDRTLFLHNWDDVLHVLQVSHGPGATVGVYPNAEIQYF